MRGWRSRMAAAARSTCSRSETSQKLELAAELEREWLEPLLPPGDEHAVPATSDELARGCLADAARCAGDNRRFHGATTYLQTRTTR